MRRKAFTLVELLIVIAIIALLLSILLPALGKAKEKARELTCASNVRQLIQGFRMFASEHNDCFPGNNWDTNRQNPDETDWLMGTSLAFTNAPDKGTIFRYVTDKRLYRCPSLRERPFGVGEGSNGRFDYTAFPAFAGAKTANVKVEGRFTYSDGRIITVNTPLVVEEDPANYINSGVNLEGGHSNVDKLAKAHRGGANVGAADGSVFWFQEPDDCTAWNWSALSPHGNWVSIGANGGTAWGWGWWGMQ